MLFSSSASPAQAQVKDLKFPVVQDINRTDQLGWHKARKRKSQKENTWYPCRLCHPDEGMGLFQEHCKDENKILVRYLGYQSDTAGTYDQINAKEFFPLTEENRDRAFDTYKRHLTQYFKADVVACRAEELAVIAMWKKVKEREVGKSSSPIHAPVELFSPPREAHPPLKVATAKPAKATYSSDSDEGMEGSDDEPNSSVATTGKKECLRDGDVIEYYDPIGVAGKQEWLRRAIILGVDPKHKSNAINLDNGQFLDPTAKIKRVRRRNRGKIEDYAGTFKQLNDYSLRSCGTMEMVAIQRMAQRAKKIRKKAQEDIDMFWQGGEEKKTLADQSTSPEIQRTTPDPKAKVSNAPKWKVHLDTLLKSTRDQIAKQRRFVPSMFPEQIECVLKVWQVLQRKIDSSNVHHSKTVVPALSTELGISTRRLAAVMHGDENKSLSTANKNEVIAILEEWLKQPTPLEEQEVEVATIQSHEKKKERNAKRGPALMKESLKVGID